MEPEQPPAPSTSAPSPSSSSTCPPTLPSSSPYPTLGPAPSPSVTSTATTTSVTTTTITTTTQTVATPPIPTATTTINNTNVQTSTSISSTATTPTTATPTTTPMTSPFSIFDHQPTSNILPLKPSFPINRNRPQTPHPHFAQHLPSPSPPSLPLSASSSPSSSSSTLAVAVPSSLTSSSSSSTLSLSSSSPLQRGGVAIGVPAAYPPRPQQSTSLLTPSAYAPPPFGHQLGGLGRLPDHTPGSSPQVRPGMQGIQTIGMMGALSGSQIRPGGVTTNLPPRSAQQQLRSQSPNNQPLASQKQQGPGLSRVSSFGPGNSQAPNVPQSHPQPWMSSQGKPAPASVLSSASYRPQFRSPIPQQRPPSTQQQQNSVPVAAQQQQSASSQQQQQQQQQHQPQQNTSQMQQVPENYPQMYHPSRMLPVSQQQQGLRSQGSTQKSISPSSTPSAHYGSLAPITSSEAVETCNQILSKRSIHELVAQIDPSERLDPEVEDILVEIADDFVESITTFACSLAKHRKSTTLEAKDVLLHMERNWNMTFPGFGGDEIKSFKKPPVNDIHKQRMVAIKKSYITTQAVLEAANLKSSAGQVPGNVKGHPAKAPAMTSPKT